MSTALQLWSGLRRSPTNGLMSLSAACSRLDCIRGSLVSSLSRLFASQTSLGVRGHCLVFENLVSLLAVKVAIGRGLLTVWPKVGVCFRGRG